MWYPASGPARDPVSVADLLRLALFEDPDLEADADAVSLSLTLTGESASIDTETARAALRSPVAATRDARPAAGPFPIVVWGVRHATVLAQAPLSQLLASRGAVVITAWSSDEPLAFVWEDVPSEDKRATIDAHAEDLAHALSVIRAEPFADTDRAVSIAWSYGGQTAAKLMTLADRVGAAVSLDANVLPDLPEESLYLRGTTVLFVGQDTTRRGLEQLAGLGRPWLRVSFADFMHGHFNAMEGYLPALLGARVGFPWSDLGPQARHGYPALATMTARLVEALAAAPSTPPGELARTLTERDGVDAEVRTSPARPD